MLASNPLYVNRRIAIEALRTTKLEQAFTSHAAAYASRYCALQVIALAWGLPADSWVEVGVYIDPDSGGDNIWKRNDGVGGHHRHSFAEIADYIESLV